MPRDHPTWVAMGGTSDTSHSILLIRSQGNSSIYYLLDTMAGDLSRNIDLSALSIFGSLSQLSILIKCLGKKTV